MAYFQGYDLVLSLDGTELICDSIDPKALIESDERKPTNSRTPIDNITGKRMEIGVKGAIDQALPAAGVITELTLEIRSGSTVVLADLPADIQAIINGDYTDWAITDGSYTVPQATAEYDFTLRSGCRSVLT